MRIGLDIMGGDFTPLEPLKGALLAKKEFPGADIVLIGNLDEARPVMQELGINENDFSLIHAPETIGMAESPTKAIMSKKQSSIAIGFGMLKEKQLDCFISAGNTGAMMVGAMYSVKPIEGIIRPVITSVLPKLDGSIGILLDVGANADCKPDVLEQFAVLGSLYCKHVYKIDNPRVGLVNIGEEKEKGNLVTQAAHQLLDETPGINFIGNIEGRDLFIDKVDVAVCDGFTGNVVLKACESLYYIFKKKRGVQDEFLDRFDYENYGGTAILGVNAPVIIGHGISKSKAFLNMIRLGKEVIESDLINKIKSSF